MIKNKQIYDEPCKEGIYNGHIVPKLFSVSFSFEMTIENEKNAYNDTFILTKLPTRMRQRAYRSRTHNINSRNEENKFNTQPFVCTSKTWRNSVYESLAFLKKTILPFLTRNVCIVIWGQVPPIRFWILTTDIHKIMPPSPKRENRDYDVKKSITKAKHCANSDVMCQPLVS